MIKTVDFEFKESYGVEDLIRIIGILRAPGGCPWDAEQTHESVRKNLIEETYEVIEAINRGDGELLKEELGDLLMQIVLHAQMEKEKGVFGFEDVCDGICKKLVERHPHVFGEVEVSGSDEVLKNWDAIKNRTKGRATATDDLRSVPRELPALMRAEKLQKKAAKIGFDWSDVSGALDKLDEETRELRQASEKSGADAAFEELGDVLFSAANVSRFLGVDAEEALTAANEKFLRRFAGVEALAEKRGLDVGNVGLDALNGLWDEVKSNEIE